MKNYLKLVHFEVNRFFKLYVIIMGLTIVSQIIGVIFESKAYLENTKRIMFENQLSFSEFIGEGYRGSPFDQFVNSGWALLPVFMCIVILMLYVFFIWYRDWFAKNTFIYRLLLLPTNRLTIYFAKMTTILLFVFGLIALQLILIPIELQIMNGIIPVDYRTNFSIYELFYFDLWTMLYPTTFMKFILSYGVGLICVAVLFTSILIERSFRLKGIFFAIVYGVLSFFVLIVPIFLMSLYPNYFYPLELLTIAFIISSIVLGIAIWLASYLLKYKITV
ncbi:hypothetical protein CSE16_14080 [Solibacillus sp. R5-41]|uniref:hypothetical protein n=1 Tax=Solibacillus sp. R5-41 TaxID=2048654 RepID=UPI000C1299E6|nr:hypothetical protein [Solibacillus sp. R5-41]ATP41090.1 hypothetical protein CSE16_14080 [Solibacillus sp. R5-41]